MKIKEIYLLLVFCMVAATNAEAQDQAPPKGGEPKDFELPEKNTLTLENGLQGTLVPFGSLPKVTVAIVVQTGNVHEKPDEIWLADLTGDLMKEGTQHLNAFDISKKIAGMGGELSIQVTPNTTRISGSVLSEFGPGLVALLADILKNPAFPASEIERLKTDLKRELNVQLASPQAQAFAKFSSLIYPEHAYGRVFPTEAMIDSYTVEKVRNFYENNFGALRTHVFVAGKFDGQAMEEAIRSSLQELKKGPEATIPVPQASAKSEVVIIDRPEAPQSTIYLGLRAPDPSEPDYLEFVSMNTLLGGSFASRITSNIREDKGYTYSPQSTISERFRTAYWAEIADVTTEFTGASLQEIAKEIEKLKNEPPSATELEGFQNYQAGIFVLQNSSPEGIIGQLAFMELHDLDERYLTERVERIYSVTPETISEMTRKYLDIDKMTLVIVGDKAVINEQIESFRTNSEG